MIACEHVDFVASVRVIRLSDKDGGAISGYTSEISIECAGCNLPLRFLGLKFGSHPTEPRLSINGTELRAPMELAIVPEIAGSPLTYGNC